MLAQLACCAALVPRHAAPRMLAEPRREMRQVSDWVGGVHGGKYEFGSPGSVSGAGRDFASALASGGQGVTEVTQADDADELPRWARAMQPQEPPTAILSFGAAGDVREVLVVNRFRTWERFFARLVPEDAAASFRLEPCGGTLAPRGGANNVCDASKPYPDSATVRVVHVGGEAPASASACCVLVGTEEEQWTYALSWEEPMLAPPSDATGAFR